MSKSLILAEKPSVAKDMAKALGVSTTGKSFYENQKYIITWAYGHLVTLATPEEYSKKYQEWKLEDLPMLPKQKKLVIIPQTKRQFYEIKKLVFRKEVNEIIIATDAGREGELVARWILEMTGVKKPLKRLWVSSVTKKAILDGFSKLHDGKKYDNLHHSAESRAEADWLVGFNGTRALTVKYNAALSCGRVQTPTLEMIFQREEEIRSFQPKEYYGIEGKAGNLTYHWMNDKNGKQTFQREKAQEIVDTLKGKTIKIDSVDKKVKKVYPAPLYDLTTLQRDANERYGFSAKETQNAMQNLYERHKILTYPRTDSRYLTKDMLSTMKERLEAMAVGRYSAIAKKLAREKVMLGNRTIDDTKVSDHHAIIPTEEPVFLEDLSERERKIYDLVASRFLSHFMKPYEYEEATVQGSVGKILLEAREKSTVNLGFYEIDGGGQGETSKKIPNLGMTIPLEKVKMTTGTTKPPAYFTEGTLLGAMENPKDYMKSGSKELKKLLKEGGGIGTVATRGDIIEKLYSTDYIQKNGQHIHLTGKGRQVLELVPEALKAPDLTAKWEGQLREIEKGKLDSKIFLKEIINFTEQITKDIKNSSLKYIHENITGKSCPECGKPLLAVNRKDKEMEVCSDRNCGYRRTISQLTNARCPECHKKLTLIGEGDKRFFQCSCGHREGYDIYLKRKNDKKKQMSKGEVKKYLKQQGTSKEEVNTSLADALKGLKL